MLVSRDKKVVHLQHLGFISHFIIAKVIHKNLYNNLYVSHISFSGVNPAVFFSPTGDAVFVAALCLLGT